MQDAGAQRQQRPPVNVAALRVPPLHPPLGVAPADWYHVRQQHSVATQIAVALVVNASALAISWAKRLRQVAQSAVRQLQPLQRFVLEGINAPVHITGLAVFWAACAALDNTPLAWRFPQGNQPRAWRWPWQMTAADWSNMLHDVLVGAALAGAVARDFGWLWSRVFIPFRAYLAKRS